MSQLVLVIVVVVVGLVIAAAVSLRALKSQHSAASAKGATLAQPAPAVSAYAHDTAPAARAGAGAAASAPTTSSDPATAQPAAPDVAPTTSALTPSTAAAAAQRSTTASSATTPPEDPPPRALSPADIFSKLHALGLGVSRSGSMLSAGHEVIAAATAAAVDDAATQERYAPRRPNMLPRLLSAANDDNVSRRELATIIARDPSLVGNLLKIANSSYYRITAEPVESVDRAVILLGTDGIRSLITAALMQPIFRIGGAAFPKFPEVAWEHTFRSASAAVPYTFLVENADPFAAELLSLVMGLAGIVVFRVAMDQYATDMRLRPDAGVVASLLDKHSPGVARRIGASWELSERTLAGLNNQGADGMKHASPLGRSLYFGRVVGALAVLRMSRAINEETAKMSIPATTMPPAQVDRMWTRLTPHPVPQKS